MHGLVGMANDRFIGSQLLNASGDANVFIALHLEER
jgi:hypothetical protein